VLWNIFSGVSGKGFFQTVGNVTLKWLLLFLAGLLCIRLIYLAARKREFEKEMKFNSLYALFAAGFAAMGLEIILVFAYQNMFGYLYQKIGMIVALFMTGLAMGAYVMNKRIGRSPFTWPKILLGIEVTITAYSLVLPIVLGMLLGFQEKSGAALISELIFMLLVLFSGGLTGIAFPLVNGILIQQGESPGKAAGLADGFDHLGAALGAAIIGTLLIPLLGTPQSCLFTASLNLVASLLILHFLVREARQ